MTFSMCVCMWGGLLTGEERVDSPVCVYMGGGCSQVRSR